VEVVLFHRPGKNPILTQAKPLKDLTRMLTVVQFLGEDKRKTLLNKMRDLCGLETSRYESLCTVLVENLVNYCQSLPETSNSYYSQPGGLVDHSLNRTEAALSLFQEFMVQEQPGFYSEEQMLWQYALYSAAILQGIGKLFVDYQINLFDANGQLLKPWNPLLESLINTGSYYAFDFQKESDIEFRRRLNLLLAKSLMPVSGFTWIASNPQILEVWLALLNEDQRSAGTLGAILIRAEAQAIQRYLAEFINRSGVNRSWNIFWWFTRVYYG
jgi:integrating conjugative element relaxase (TIGR03760 family)